MLYGLLAFGIIGLIVGILSKKELSEADKHISTVGLGEYLIYSYGTVLLLPGSIGIIIGSIILIFMN